MAGIIIVLCVIGFFVLQGMKDSAEREDKRERAKVGKAEMLRRDYGKLISYLLQDSGTRIIDERPYTQSMKMRNASGMDLCLFYSGLSNKVHVLCGKDGVATAEFDIPKDKDPYRGYLKIRKHFN
ncbi:MAG: hypothetical protein II951_08910 [Bacteroidales bacterium]|nr:hypothetical protein [Bacteroidales bacterium]